jgi:hypothetical protein
MVRIVRPVVARLIRRSGDHRGLRSISVSIGNERANIMVRAVLACSPPWDRAMDMVSENLIAESSGARTETPFSARRLAKRNVVRLSGVVR